MNPRHLQMLVVRPALETIELWSPEAEMLVLGTAAQESRFQYLKQLGTGPALGLWQCEPRTHADIWENYIRYRQELAVKVRATAGHGGASTLKPEDDWLVYNLRYAAAICRIHYRRAPDPLPRDVKGFARYWKRFYNTEQGRGTEDEFIDSFKLVEDIWKA